MTVFHAIVLGLVQGLTEFLPISSSGHLVLTQYFLGITEGAISFDVFVHFSTLLAVILFFRKRILKLTRKDLVFISIASVPAVILGLLFKDILEHSFSSLYFVLGTLFVTGCINFAIARLLRSRPVEEGVELTAKRSLRIGLFQAMALLPGISRSGSTVLGAVVSKLSRRDAFEFSFILSIPIILGGSMLQFFEVYSSGELATLRLFPYLAGGLAAFSAGIISLRVFRYVIEKARFEWFGWYCIGLVVFVVLFDIVPTL